MYRLGKDKRIRLILMEFLSHFKSFVDAESFVISSFLIPPFIFIQLGNLKFLRSNRVKALSRSTVPENSFFFSSDRASFTASFSDSFLTQLVDYIDNKFSIM